MEDRGKMINIISLGHYSDMNWDVEIIPVYDGEKTKIPLEKVEYGFGETAFFRARAGNEKNFLFVGLGNKLDITPYKLRCVGGIAGRFIRENGYNRIYLNQGFNFGAGEFVEGLLLGAYKFNCYKKSDKNCDKDIIIYIAASSINEEEVKSIQNVVSGVWFARDLVNMPPNVLFPQTFAEIITKRFKDTSVNVKVFKDDEIVKEEFVGLAAVGHGSSHKLRYVMMTYKTDKSKPLIALVGKGITFDMGGMNIKTGDNLSGLKNDMAAAAAVVGAMDIIHNQNIKGNIIAFREISFIG